MTVLDGVSFVIPAGCRVALVGPNGSGKSTIVKLLTRQYEPDSGQILVDGVPIEEFAVDDLRAGLGVVFQDFVRFELTMRDDVGFGDVGLADQRSILAAAASSGASDVLARLPQELDTLLGRRFAGAVQVSSGQWQRIALARGLVSGAGVLVMDEPSAALDPEAEADLVDRLSALDPGATCVVVAHRFPTIRTADRIVVVDEGRVVASGNHDELISEAGLCTDVRGARGVLHGSTDDGSRGPLMKIGLVHPQQPRDMAHFKQLDDGPR